MKQTQMEVENHYDENVSDTELQIAYEKGLIKPGLIQLQQKKRSFQHVNNVKGLKNKLRNFKLDLPFPEILEFSCEPAPLAPEIVSQIYKNRDEHKNETDETELVHNEFEREMYFYRLGQSAVLEAIPKLREFGPTKRPDDYFAQMSKSDEQMHKVREQLKIREKKMEGMEKAKKLRELKKFGKKVQIEKTQEKLADKRKMLLDLKKYRKGKGDSLDFLDENRPKKSSDDVITKIKSDKRKKHELKEKRKEKKFGLNTGKKRGWKRNAAGDVDNKEFFQKNKNKKNSKFSKFGGNKFSGGKNSKNFGANKFSNKKSGNKSKRK